MKLGIPDRLYIPFMLPKQGKLIEMMVVETVTNMVKFTKEEISEFDLKDSGNGVTWKVERDIEKEFSFTPEQINCLKDSVKKMDEAGQITIDMLNTCRKISDYGNNQTSIN